MPSKKISEKRKQQIRERANGFCEYCLAPEDFSPNFFTVEHIIPSIKGGSDELHNLAFACPACNGSKYDKTEATDPETGEIAPLYNPRQDKWELHFEWNSDTTRILGKTPTGRATVAALKLNRSNLVNLRFGLVILGEHPPNHLSKQH